jgi:hypothetical protein
VNLIEFLSATDTNLHRVSQSTGIAYSTLHKHVKHQRPLSLPTARKLEAFDPRMTAAEILGVGSPTPQRRPRKKAA